MKYIISALKDLIIITLASTFIILVICAFFGSIIKFSDTIFELVAFVVILFYTFSLPSIFLSLHGLRLTKVFDYSSRQIIAISIFSTSLFLLYVNNMNLDSENVIWISMLPGLFGVIVSTIFLLYRSKKKIKKPFKIVLSFATIVVLTVIINMGFHYLRLEIEHQSNQNEQKYTNEQLNFDRFQKP
jgi:hypothetical protein